jgi:hypothetical protein
MATPKIRGREVGSMSRLKASLTKRSGSFIQTIPADGMVVRFLTEPDKWRDFTDHWDDNLRASYCCIEGQCPGCAQELKRSSKHLANVVNIETDEVVPLKLGFDVANRIVMKHDKYHTIMDRNYEITRSGEGFDTKYDVSAEPQELWGPRKLAKYPLIDLETALFDQFKSVWGTEEDDLPDEIAAVDDTDEEDEVTPPRVVSKRRATPVPITRSSTNHASSSSTNGAVKKRAAAPAAPAPARRVFKRVASNTRGAAPTRTNTNGSPRREVVTNTSTPKRIIKRAR